MTITMRTTSQDRHKMKHKLWCELSPPVVTFPTQPARMRPPSPKRGTQRVKRDLLTQKHKVDTARVCGKHVQSCERGNHGLCSTSLADAFTTGLTRTFTKHRWHWELCSMCTTDASNCLEEVSKPTAAISSPIPSWKRDILKSVRSTGR